MRDTLAATAANPQALTQAITPQALTCVATQSLRQDISQHAADTCSGIRYILKPILILMAIIAIGCFDLAAQVGFSGNILPVISDTPDSSTGLQAVYVVNRTQGVSITYTSSGGEVNWMKFSTLGGGYAQNVPFTRQGNTSSVALTTEDMGYIIEESGRRTCVWVVNYENHTASFGALTLASEQDCVSAALNFTGSADRIIYYTVNGAARTLSRGITLEYNTLEFNAERNVYTQELKVNTLEYLTNELHIPSPLCPTEFYLSGDRFQITWGGGKTIQSPTFTPKAVEAVTTATQADRSIDNEQKTDQAANALGGSAPVEITFDAAVTDGAIYREWQFASDPQFDQIDIRINDLKCTRTFTEYGTVFARFVCGDDTGDCEWISETYTINVGESKLECPNAFSPGTSPGSNDEWKVSYKSIVEFDCHIFNRWGIEVAHLTDPSQGWDGRYNGKLVKSGVFYYVIKAKGADGKDYKLSGDINIIHARRNSTGQ